jgi:exodeoxyribonuclease VII large subunit
MQMRLELAEDEPGDHHRTERADAAEDHVVGPTDGPYTWTVSELHEWLAAAISERVPHQVWIEGEIANLNRSRNDHVYFSLIEVGEDHAHPRHSLSVALFDWHRQNVNRQLTRAGGAIRMENGVRVRIKGDLELYGRRLQVQLKMVSIDPVFTVGDLEARRRQLLAELAAAGLLTANASLPLAALPLRIGLITATGSAAAADFLHELATSELGFEVLQLDTPVQGEGAAERIATGIAQLGALDVDLIAVVRGGGARTDLACFDSAVVAHAIVTCPVPVWSGIGHEIDTAVADAVAHRAHKTPTACAAGLVEHCRAAIDRVEQQFEAVLDAAEMQLNNAARGTDRFGAAVGHRCGSGIDAAANRLAARAQQLTRMATSHVERATRRLDRGTETLNHLPFTQLDRREHRLELAAARIQADDPRRLLERGWSITRDQSGRAVRSISSVRAGDTLTTHVRDGSIHTTVDGVVPDPSLPGNHD